jgi:hypothetical protein
MEKISMADFVPVTEEELARAQQDPAFRRKLLADNLEALLTALNKMRNLGEKPDADSARQIRDGVDMAVKLANLLQAAKGPPQAA